MSKGNESRNAVAGLGALLAVGFGCNELNEWRQVPPPLEDHSAEEIGRLAREFQEHCNAQRAGEEDPNSSYLSDIVAERGQLLVNALPDDCKGDSRWRCGDFSYTSTVITCSPSRKGPGLWRMDGNDTVLHWSLE